MAEHQPDPKHADRVREDVRMLYQVSGAATAYLKTQQWQSTYYILVTYAAIVGYAALIKPLTGCEVVALAAIAAASGAFGVYFLWNTKGYIDRYRSDVKAFVSPADTRLNANHKISPELGALIFRVGDEHTGRDLPILLVAGATITLGWLMVLYVLARFMR